MAFDFDIEYIKGNFIPHVDILSRRKFNNGELERSDNSEVKILHWIGTDRSCAICKFTGSCIEQHCM